MTRPLTKLEVGMPIVYGGNRVTIVDAGLADAFTDGDRLVVVQDSGDLLHIPAGDWDRAVEAVDAAVDAFTRFGSVTAEQLTHFYQAFASYLEDESSFEPIAEANVVDVDDATNRGRSITRLVLSEQMRGDMVAGLRLWAGRDVGRAEVIERIDHDGWVLEQVKSGLGVVGFVFEGRPNVFADATGVLAAGNTVVFRIGSDALGTARAIMSHALVPALKDADLPVGTVSLVDAPSHASAWAMFSDSRLGLAVARGSGGAVAQLGAVARQTGTPVSLHGTGGAWIIAAESADADVFASAVYHSLDRKVCNTLNTACIVVSRADELVPAFLDALDRAGRRRGATSKLHVTSSSRRFVPDAWLETATIVRATGEVSEPRTELIGDDQLGREWEWEVSPEVTLAIVPDVQAAIHSFNEQSPRFVASLISEDDVEQRTFFDLIDAPFVGDGFTRWVDGQYALNRPELGLSNWQFGRLFGRGGVLSGDSVFTVRSRVRQTDPNIGR